jgi:hypothetical protein
LIDPDVLWWILHGDCAVPVSDVVVWFRCCIVQRVSLLLSEPAVVVLALSWSERVDSKMLGYIAQQDAGARLSDRAVM